MQIKPRAHMGIGLIALSMIFFFNAEFAVFDLLPDVFGYILLSLGMSSLSYLNHHFEESAKHFRRMIALSAGRLVFVLVLFLNHLFEEDKLSKLAELMEKIIGIILKLGFGAVIGLGVVQSLLSPMKDRLANNVMLSSMSSIPGVGGALGSAGEILFSCGLLIKNSVGIVGLIVLFIISVIPVLKIGCFWIMYHILAVILQPVADIRLVECVSGVARGCDLYLKIILYAMLLFFVLIAMATMATSFVF